MSFPSIRESKSQNFDFCPLKGKKENTVLLKLPQKMNEQQTIAELVETLQTRLEKGQFKDAVHKIKLMTTLETVQRMLNGQ